MQKSYKTNILGFFFEEGCEQIAKYTRSTELPWCVSCSAGIQDEKQAWKLPSEQETHEASDALTSYLCLCDYRKLYAIVTQSLSSTTTRPCHLTMARRQSRWQRDGVPRSAVRMTLRGRQGVSAACTSTTSYDHFCQTLARCNTKSLLELVAYHSIQHVYR